MKCRLQRCCRPLYSDCQRRSRASFAQAVGKESARLRLSSLKGTYAITNPCDRHRQRIPQRRWRWAGCRQRTSGKESPGHADHRVQRRRCSFDGSMESCSIGDRHRCSCFRESTRHDPSLRCGHAANSNGLLLSLHPRFRSSGSHWTRTRITATPATPDCVCHRRQKFHCWSRPFPQGCKGGAEGNRTDQPAAKFGLACIKRFRVYGVKIYGERQRRFLDNVEKL